MSDSCCSSKEKSKIDIIFWGSAIIIALFLAIHYFNIGRNIDSLAFLQMPAEMVVSSVVLFLPGVLLGIFFAIVISFIPIKITQKAFGNNKNIFISLIRAVGFGLLFDVCNHGVLFIAQKFYKQGIKTPAVIAFLVATPWNSVALTVIMFNSFGTLYASVFIALSMLVAIMTGFIVDILITKGVLPANQNQLTDDNETSVENNIEDNTSCCSSKKKEAKSKKILKNIWSTIQESTSVLKWIFFGIVLSVLIRSVFGEDNFSKFFAPTLLGLLATLFLATIIETCSEGTLPLGIDIFTIAKAKGNSFAFMMSGVATDFTEFMVLKELTGSKKLAVLVILVLIVQVVLLAMLLNRF